jgi:hypothetical protein
VTLKPFREPELQMAASQACARFNRDRIKTVTGQMIHMTMADCN